MTTKQRQLLLAYLGYYKGEIDGIWGASSRTATVAFQRDFGLTVDGIVGAGTENALKQAIMHGMPVKNWWDDIKHFTRDEFKCGCKGKFCKGFPVEPDKKLVQILDKVRKHFGKAFSPNSAIRCTKHNAKVGGKSNSQHLRGTAADISIPGVAPKTVAAYLETLLPNTGGIGVYNWGVHVDTRKVKARWNG